MDNFTIPVNIITPDLQILIDDMKVAIKELKEATFELRKIKTGSGLAIGVDLDEEGRIMPANFESIEKSILAIKTSKIVSCPINPREIPGIGAAAIYIAAECLGTITVLSVPRWGIIESATYFDLDDEGSQTDLEIFKGLVTQVADNAAWTLSAVDNPQFITELNFFSFDDHLATQTSDIRNIGKAYSAPEGKFYIQAVTRGTPTIAAGASPRFRLQILSLDPDFVES